MRSIEAYIETWPATVVSKRKDNVGTESEISSIHLVQRPRRAEHIDVSDMLEGPGAGVKSCHINMDETTQSRFEASDMTVSLSLLMSGAGRTRPPGEGNFWNKLPADRAGVWSRFMEIIDGGWVGAATRDLTFSYFHRVLNFAWTGIIDKTTISIDEINGTVTFTAYSALKGLETIPASWITNTVVYGVDRVAYRRWFLGLGLTTAINLIAARASECTDYRRWIPAPFVDIDPAFVEDFAGFVLSMYGYDAGFDSANPYIRNFTYAGADILYFDLTSEDLSTEITSPAVGGYALETTALDLADSIAGPATKFANWERHTPLGVEPGSLDVIPMPGNRTTGDPWFGKPYGIQSEFGNSYAYTAEGPTLEIWRYPWEGYETGVYASGKNPKWGAGVYLGNAASVVYSARIIVEPMSYRWPYLFIAADSELLRFDEVGLTTTSFKILASGNVFSGLFYFVNNDILFAVEEHSGAFDRLHVIDVATLTTLHELSGDIPPLDDYDGYALSWADIDYSSMFEIAYYRNTTADSETAYVGLTSTGPTRLFILSEDLTKCIYWVNLEDMAGIPLGGRAEITRRYRSESATITLPDGSTEVRTYNYNEVWGYIGGGHTYDTIIFSINLATSGEVRVLNLNDMNLAQAWAELAKFAGAAMYETHEVVDRGEGEVKITPRLNIVSRSLLHRRAIHWYLDPIFIDWQRNALYDKYFTRLKIDFKGGKTEMGINDPALGETVQIRELGSGSVAFGFIFDFHFARARGNGILKYHAQPRQKWTVSIPLETTGPRIIQINDIIHLRYTALRAHERKHETARVIAVDYDFEGKMAVVTAVTESANDPNPPVTNPMGSTPTIEQISKPES